MYVSSRIHASRKRVGLDCFLISTPNVINLFAPNIPWGPDRVCGMQHCLFMTEFFRRDCRMRSSSGMRYQWYLWYIVIYIGRYYGILSWERGEISINHNRMAIFCFLCDNNEQVHFEWNLVDLWWENASHDLWLFEAPVHQEPRLCLPYQIFHRKQFSLFASCWYH